MKTAAITDLHDFPALFELDWFDLGEKPVQVWYAKRLGDTPRHAESLALTHVHLLTIHQPDKEAIYTALQGDRWSPNGEARPFLEAAGLTHTSMSMGDILMVDGQVLECAACGWEVVPSRYAEA
jgi:hypothetical protein